MSRRPPSRPTASRAAAKPKGAARVAETCQFRARKPAKGLPSRPPGRHPWKRETTCMRLGLRPYGWTREAYCSHCGPVFLPTWYAIAGWHLDTCPWCYDATARGVEIVQRPMVTCEGCRYFLPHPRGPSERGGCAIGQRAYQPKRPHECAWWRPQP